MGAVQHPLTKALLRLCLVYVKAFPENIPFFRNAIFWKEKCFHVFGCISKNFLKNIFWCLEKKKEKTNPDKPRRRRRQRDLDLREIAIDGAIDDHDRRASRLSSTLIGRSHRSLIDEGRDQRSVLSDLGSLFSLSLSLSLSFRKWFEVKRRCKIISRSKVKISVDRKQFSEKWNLPLLPNTWVWGKMISWNHFHPKQTHPNIHTIN